MHRIVIVLLGACLTTACGGPTDVTSEQPAGARPAPLEGTWGDGTWSITFAPGRAFSMTLTKPGCTGAWIYSGGRWSATDTTVTVLGPETCSGSWQCGGSSEPCVPLVGETRCPFVLGDRNHTLTFRRNPPHMELPLPFDRVLTRE